MKQLLIPAILCLTACHQTKTASVKDSAQVQIPDTIKFTPPVIVPERGPADTLSIIGDFNGDGVSDTASAALYKKVTGDYQDQYKISFHSNALPDMPIVFGRTRLVNEGDLDRDGTDELSTFSEPLYGCTYTLNVWSFKNGEWEPYAGPILVPTACDVVTDEDLQKRIVMENDTAFIWETDVNDEDFKLVKRPLGATAEERMPGMAAPKELREAHSSE